MAAKKYVYKFSEGNGSMRELLGGKGANLCEMYNIGLPVPQGYIITTEACNAYYDDGEKINDKILSQILAQMKWLQKATGKKLGDLKNPLLVSVRSGARASMPGMMDTILNLGINDNVVKSIAEISGNKRFAYDSYRRFIQMFSDVVMGLSKTEFEKIITAVKEEKGVKLDIDLDADDMVELSERFKEFYKANLGKDFPQDPEIQLVESIKAVFRSWNNERANYYRKMNDIPSNWGTAVSIVEMVFGNMGTDCGTGVCFSRDPSTGEHRFFYGEYLINAQGEDVVAGIRTPQQISKKGSIEWAKRNNVSEEDRKAKYPSLEENMPNAYKDLDNVRKKLEQHYHDMQDMEFTIEHGHLYMLQTRNGKRTAAAALKVAVDMVKEGLVTTDKALMMVEPRQLDDLLHPTFDPAALKAKSADILTTGLPASPGAASGHVVFDAAEAKERAAAGMKVVLVRLETSPEDIEGMHVAQGIMTVRGGMTSHAAVVARGMGRCCVSGCGDVNVDEDAKTFTIHGETFHDGDMISLDGTSGHVYRGEISTVPASISGNFKTFMSWADKRRTLHVRTNSDTPADTKRAYEFGAEGVGLVRTEHMFFNDDERIAAIRKMIVSRTIEERRKYLNELLPMQRSDFEGIYEEMRGQSVTVRLLDPPLHEFVPKEESQIVELAKEMGMSVEELNETCNALHEFNPMMGHRGCRLDVTYPEIGEMQTRAIIEAAININKKHRSWHLVPEIMIPLVGDPKELKYVKDIVVHTADQVIKENRVNMEYEVGTMIEIPRAALLADEIAKEAEFFSFGTNDLTQMTFGFSRDDAGHFLKDYYDKHIYESDPFAHVDQNGVGQLIQMASDKGRTTRPDIKLGVCGEHGGDPASIEFFNRVGLTYVSCSPYRVPIARLAAAQAAIRLDIEKANAKVSASTKKAVKKTASAKVLTVKKKAKAKPAMKKAAKKAAVKSTAKKAVKKSAGKKKK